MDKNILKTNKTYWDTHADAWLDRRTALPIYGMKFPTEDDLGLFGDVFDKKLLEICCGSGHSLKYHADRGAGELWGLDISNSQIELARAYLQEHGHTAKFICAPMEADADIPTDYFDYVYSIYGIGWTTDLQGTFNKIVSYLKKDGVFIFSWHHTLNYCAAWSCEERKIVIENDVMAFGKSYFDESWFKLPIDGTEVLLCNRKISTYINALAKAGFVMEQMVEQTDDETMKALDDDNYMSKKARMLPLSVCFKARKL
ncbi:MAG: class I SAM-dependent methyltransferase [Defluviitaleaceae bacterium]|nr:class I SAM-dependent methyltransferase [Defluviitaleaceae bacterium]